MSSHVREPKGDKATVGGVCSSILPTTHSPALFSFRISRLEFLTFPRIKILALMFICAQGPSWDVAGREETKGEIRFLGKSRLGFG